MIPYIHANQTQNGIYLATQDEIKEIKRKYPWWYAVTAGDNECILHYITNPLKYTTAGG